MARKRAPERNIAKELFIDSKGTLTPKEISEKMNIPADKIRKWKSVDKWEEELKKRKRGAPQGNKNAKGHGAPQGNKNAETHGGYSAIDFNNLPEEERKYIEAITLQSEENMLQELRILKAKERDIRKRLDELELKPEDEVFLTRIAEMHTAYNLEELEGLEPQEKEKLIKELRPRMKTITKESKFERYVKLMNAFDRIHGRIIKLIDTIKNYEIDKKKVELDALRYDLAKQKATGAIEIEIEEG